MRNLELHELHSVSGGDDSGCDVTYQTGDPCGPPAPWQGDDSMVQTPPETNDPQPNPGEPAPSDWGGGDDPE
jgi:hypothetical protein